jgi:hypothetical protein
MVACLDANMRLTCIPAELAGPAEGRATAVALGSSPSSKEGVRAVIARSGRVGVSLEGLRLGSDGAPLVAPWRLIDLDAPPSFEVAFERSSSGTGDLARNFSSGTLDRVSGRRKEQGWGSTA